VLVMLSEGGGNPCATEAEDGDPVLGLNKIPWGSGDVRCYDIPRSVPFLGLTFFFIVLGILVCEV